MAQGKKPRHKKAKKGKPVGIQRKGGKFYTCQYCGKKKKRLHELSMHYAEDHPHATKRKPKRKTPSIQQMRNKGLLDGISDQDLANAAIIAQQFANPSKVREFTNEVADRIVDKRRRRGW